ncbi:MAG: tetratricopeptide repeat protein [Acidobacteriota bacterium]|nr:tetratricopeptide repeat protein [Acidobacteriota bacterium]
MAKLSSRIGCLKDLARLVPVVLIGVLVASASTLAQQKKEAPRPKTRAEFDAYTQLYNEKDMRRKAMLAGKFIADFPESDYLLGAYQLEIQANDALGNHEKVVSAGEKALQEFPEAGKAPRIFILQRMIRGYQQLNNPRKTIEAAESLLTVESSHLPTLLTLSMVLPRFLPEDEAGRARQFDRALEIAHRAQRRVDAIVNGPKPAALTPAQWVRQKADLPARVHAALGLIHFNSKDYPSAIEEYEKATSLARGDSVDFYRMGIAYYYQALAVSRELAEWDQKENPDTAAKEEKEAQFASWRDKAITALAKVIALQEGAPAQVVESARAQLESLYRSRNNDSLDGLEAVIAEAARELGSGTQ